MIKAFGPGVSPKAQPVFQGRLEDRAKALEQAERSAAADQFVNGLKRKLETLQPFLQSTVLPAVHGQPALSVKDILTELQQAAISLDSSAGARTDRYMTLVPVFLRKFHETEQEAVAKVLIEAERKGLVQAELHPNLSYYLNDRPRVRDDIPGPNRNLFNPHTDQIEGLQLTDLGTFAIRH